MSQSEIHTETTFEKDIVDLLTSTGEYQQGLSVDINKDTGHAPDLILRFIKTSQPKEWERFVTIHQEHADAIKTVMELNTIIKKLEKRNADLIDITSAAIKYHKGDTLESEEGKEMQKNKESRQSK